MSNGYPRETIEFIPVTVTVDGTPVTTGVMFSITRLHERPTVWVEPIILEDRIGVMTQHQTPGTYLVWAKVSDDPETPVILCGAYVVT